MSKPTIAPKTAAKARVIPLMAATRRPTPAESKVVTEKLADLEQQMNRTSILNWDAWKSRDVKVLARDMRAVSELTQLAVQGLRGTLGDGDTLSVDDAEWKIVDELLGMASLGSFVLARELGALPDAATPKAGA